MIPLKCPTCGLRWNVREDTPATVTCPMCLAAVPKPPPVIVPMMQPPPLPPLEQDVNRDMRASGVGVWILLGVIAMGIVGTFLTGWPARSGSAVVLLGVLALAGATALIIAVVGFPGTGSRRGGTAQTVVSICVAVFLIMGGCVALLFGACAMLLTGL